MQKKEMYWLDGHLAENSLILSDNRSFLFGDGFFETMRWSPKGNCPLWSYHWDRIVRTVAALGFPWPNNWTEEFFKAIISSAIFDSGATAADQRVKLIFWRQGGSRYEAIDPKLALLCAVESFPFPWIQEISKVGIAESIRIPKHTLSWIKSTSAMLYVAAANERKQRNLEDIILKNEHDFVIEGGHSCLFWGKGNAIFLPDQNLGGLDSCMRKFLENHWKENQQLVRLVSEKWAEIPNVDWIGFGSGTGLRICELTKNSGFRNQLPWQE